MSETVKVACPGCDAIFAIPVELCGELGECTECDTVFEIPELHPGKKEEKVKPIIPKMSAEDIEATGTVKLSRASIGMIPDLKDAFNFGVADDKSAVHTSQMAEAFATPAPPRPTPQEAPKQEAPKQEAPKQEAPPATQPAAEKPRHGGLSISKPKTPPQTGGPSAQQVEAQKIQEADSGSTNTPPPSTPAGGLDNVGSIIITEDGLSEKDKIVTLLLCMFLGIFGAHRFYVGKIITGFFMMITFGGFGIWCFIDLIMIVTDNFKDVDGLPMK